MRIVQKRNMRQPSSQTGKEKLAVVNKREALKAPCSFLCS